MSQVAVKAWGNSQGIRLSKEIMEKMELKISDILDVEISADAIILRKAFRHRSFEERMMEYNNKISACNFDWDEPAGREIL